ncbi:SCO6880 family protein [Kribbella sp. NPDC048928]|uniref:SCO6880 family protein n=1 Tax=Kribbella sp. NPDC048928 TaxID=3364111 RepID=UPI00371A99E4
MAEASVSRTYGNWRKPVTAGLGRLGTIGTGAVLVLGIVAILAWTAAGVGAGLVVVVIGAVIVLGLVLRDRHELTAAQRLGERVGYQRATAANSRLYRSGPLGKAGWGTYQLPGLLASTRLIEGKDSWDRPFAVVAWPSLGHYAVVISCEPDGAGQVDQEQIDNWVGGWGQWLRNLGHEDGVIGAAVTVETAPDTGYRLGAEVRHNLSADAPDVARQMLAEVIDSYPQGAAQVKAWITITFSSQVRTGSRASEEDMVLELSTRLPTLTSGLASTGAGHARPATAQEVCETVRIAYDPASAFVIDEARAMGQRAKLRWSDIGPASHEAFWDKYRHDGAWSVTWAMTVAPRGEVYENVLQPLLAPHRAIVRKRVTILYKVMDPGIAARIVESDRRNSDFRLNSSKVPAARLEAERSITEKTAREEARGAGLVDFAMLVTATVTDKDRFPEAVAVVERLGSQARMQLRPQFGSQDSAFTVALPLGIVPEQHLVVPSSIRGAL